MIGYSVLASGSKGNSTYVKIGEHGFLIDCGLSCKAVEARLISIGVDPQSIEGIFVTHEHDDHIRSAHTFSYRFGVPIFTSEKTFLASGFKDKRSGEFVPVKPGKVFSPCAGIDIFPCPIPHDAVDPVGYVVMHENIKFSQMTDLGYPTELVVEEIRGSHILVVEANHDPSMLKMSHYPWELKQRIMSRRGHLSNLNAAELLKRTITGDTVHVTLAHLSEENNHPDIALMTTLQKLNGETPRVTVASQGVPTPLLLCEVPVVR